jgi:hypothetical protein
LLQQAAHADLKKFVQIAGGDSQKFHAFEQRIAKIPGFFEHAPIKFQPRFFAVEEGGAIAQSLPDHLESTMFCRICLSNQIVKIVKAGTFYTVEMSIELLETLGSSYQGTKASYQGIALTMPQTQKSHAPLGAHQPSTFSAPSQRYSGGVLVRRVMMNRTSVPLGRRKNR